MPCPCCPIEVRDLHAVAHNLTVRSPGLANGDLKRAVENMQPLMDAHFADRAHSHPADAAPAAVVQRLRAILGERAVANMRAGMNINLTFEKVAQLMWQAAPVAAAVVQGDDLPPLPKADVSTDMHQDGKGHPAFTAGMMREYGRLCSVASAFSAHAAHPPADAAPVDVKAIHAAVLAMRPDPKMSDAQHFAFTGAVHLAAAVVSRFAGKPSAAQGDAVGQKGDAK